jgi:hypothetical protein
VGRDAARSDFRDSVVHALTASARDLLRLISTAVKGKYRAGGRAAGKGNVKIRRCRIKIA